MKGYFPYIYTYIAASIHTYFVVDIVYAHTLYTYILTNIYICLVKRQHAESLFFNFRPLDQKWKS